MCMSVLIPPRQECTAAGYLNNGYSQPGLAGGSGISPNGWLFNICEQPERCSVLDGYDPGNGLAVWFTRLWQAS